MQSGQQKEKATKETVAALCTKMDAFLVVTGVLS